MRTIDRENQLTIGEIQSKRLSKRGPQTLGVVTNRLRSSIRAEKASLHGDIILTSIGSNVAYAGVHEFGIDETVTVRAHTRRVFKFVQGAATEVTFDPKTGKISRGKVKGKRTSDEINVKEHKRHMQMPARSYIRRTLQERAVNYTVSIGNTVAQLMRN